MMGAPPALFLRLHLARRFCNSWTCFESMPFFRDHCGGCSDCQTLQSGGALCDACTLAEGSK